MAKIIRPDFAGEKAVFLLLADAFVASQPPSLNRVLTDGEKRPSCAGQFFHWIRACKDRKNKKLENFKTIREGFLFLSMVEEFLTFQGEFNGSSTCLSATLTTNSYDNRYPLDDDTRYPATLP